MISIPRRYIAGHRCWSAKRRGIAYGGVSWDACDSPLSCERLRLADETLVHGILVDTDGLAALNKSLEPGAYVPAIGSDPKNPTYAGQVEFAHQLHCLVSQTLHALASIRC